MSLGEGIGRQYSDNMRFVNLPADCLQHIFEKLLAASDGTREGERQRNAWALAQCSHSLLRHFVHSSLRSISFDTEISAAHLAALCRVAGPRGLCSLTTAGKNRRRRPPAASQLGPVVLDAVAVHCRTIERLDLHLWNQNCAATFRRMVYVCRHIHSLVLRDTPAEVLRVLAASLSASCLLRLRTLRLLFSRDYKAFNAFLQLQSLRVNELDVYGQRDLFAGGALKVTAAGRDLDSRDVGCIKRVLAELAAARKAPGQRQGCGLGAQNDDKQRHFRSATHAHVELQNFPVKYKSI
jgi:hypothetical protein